MKRLLVVAAAVFLSGTKVALAESFKVSGPVTFTAVGTPGFLKIEGEGAKASGDITTAPDGSYLGVITVELKGLKTGIDLRDEHMHKKYLESAKYPVATLKLKEGLKGQGGKFCGELTVKGQTKAVCGEASLTDDSTGKRVKAKLTVNVKDFPAIGVPSAMGVTMADTVDVEADLTAKK